ncbi:hypothetical protein F2Q68_00036985, partial [Brassica cretica]
ATRVCGASGALTRSSSVGESKESSTAALLVNRSRSGSDLTSPRQFCRASLPPFGVMAVFKLTDSKDLFFSFKLRQPGVSQLRRSRVFTLDVSSALLCRVAGGSLLFRMRLTESVLHLLRGNIGFVLWSIAELALGFFARRPTLMVYRSRCLSPPLKPLGATSGGSRKVLELTMRVLALVLTMVAATVLGVAKQTKVVSIKLIPTLPPLDVSTTAKASYLSAFV